MEGYDPAYGARPLRRLIQREIGDQLARMLLAGEAKDGDTVLVEVADFDAGALGAGESPEGFGTDASGEGACGSGASETGGASGASGAGAGYVGLGAGDGHRLKLTVKA